MANDERVEMLINGIEADLKRLQELTGHKHISAFVIGDFYHFVAYKDNDEIAISICKTGEENE